MFSKACGTFGFKFGYSELNDEHQQTNTTSNKQQDVSIELLSTSDGKQFLYLIISGMTCADCVTTLEDKLKSLDGIFQVSTNLFIGKCKINYSPTIILPNQIISTIETIGFSAKQDNNQSSNSTTNQITIELISNNNQSDHSISNLIDEIKNSIDGIIDVTGNSNKLSIIHDIQIIGSRNLFIEISNLLNSKFNIKIELSSSNGTGGGGGGNKSSSGNSLKPLLLLLCILLFIPTILISYIIPYISIINKIFEYEIIGNNDAISVSTLLLWLFATPIQFYVGKPLYISAWKTLVYAKKCSMDLLVITSSTIAHFYSLINVFLNIAYPSYNGPIFFETCIILK